MLGAGLWTLLAGAPPVRPQFPNGLLVLAGLLVGFGTSLAGGCTSGHGVCGVARGSRRSLVATTVFLAAAVASTYVMRHILAMP
jgi:uncharacterized membrane protein YedE/YeeE